MLRALREARGVTQGGWAVQLSVGRRTVQRWEAGEQPPDPSAEAAIVAYCREQNLFRAFTGGPLAGLDLTPDLLHHLLAEARLSGDGQSAGLAATQSSVLSPQHPNPSGLSPSGRSLPAPLTRFVGREQELAAVRRALAGARLLTLTGTGGCGKTRLALALAEELLWAYPHGVWFVELAALADPELLPVTVAAALGLWTADERPVTELLVEHLAPRHLLLVLDNCEHLLGACAVLVETLLRACPHLEILTTSREPLGIGGEALWPVPSLLLPSQAVGVVETDAVRLFVARAQQYLPDFALTVANEAAVIHICEQLDGIPLALELAAACVKVLSVEQIADRLSDRFHLLTGGSRTALPRHQTLRATMDWSWDLLTGPEQVLLRHLSVFAGGFTLEAAEVVGAVDTDILARLAALVDKSLVIAEPQDSAARYRLLETVRQYAGEKLDDEREAVAARNRHLVWHLVLAQAASAETHGPQEPMWLDRLEQEHDNLRVALAWALTGGTGGDAPDRRRLGSRTEPALSEAKGSPIPNEGALLRLAGTLTHFWELRGHIGEGRRWLARALAAAQSAPTALRAMALHSIAELAYAQGDYTAARSSYERSLLLSQEIGDTDQIADTQYRLGMVAFRCGDYAAARALFEMSLVFYTELGSESCIAIVQNALGFLALRQGEYAAARAHLETSLALHRELGNKYGIADALDDLATVAGEQGNAEDQTAVLEEALALYRELGAKGGVARVLGDLGMRAWVQGDGDRALTLLEESLALYRDRGESRSIARLLGNQGVVALSQRDPVRAATLCRESLAVYRASGDTWGIGRYLPVLAGALFAQGQPERAARLYAAGVALRDRLGTPLPPVVQPSHDRTVAAIRAALGNE
ncbi:MAG: ATP-binding protein, partial [Dehalococcoidia bacterium]